MGIYHPRRPERMISDSSEWLEIIRGQDFFTLALCKENEPYLASLSYGYDPEENCFYFHASPKGKKMDFLASNPVVWGQILEDHGVMANECNHAYRMVQFKGKAEFLQDREEKRRAVHLMIDQLAADPEAMKAKEISDSSLENVAIVRVRVESMTGKRNPIQKS